MTSRTPKAGRKRPSAAGKKAGHLAGDRPDSQNTATSLPLGGDSIPLPSEPEIYRVDAAVVAEKYAHRPPRGDHGSTRFPWREHVHRLEAGIEEMNDDMLVQLKQLQGLQSQLSELSELVHALRVTHLSELRSMAISLDNLRRDLISERQAFSARSTFNAVLPCLDSLMRMQSAANRNSQSEFEAQLAATVDTLRRALSGLGFTEFTCSPGERYDPVLMECLGEADGENGVVLAIVRPGYRVGTIIARPCGVLISCSSNETEIQ